MKCVKCGNEFDGKFCPECGTPAQTICPKCGAPVSGKFCTLCGTALADVPRSPRDAMAYTPQPTGDVTSLRCPRCGSSQVSVEREQSLAGSVGTMKLPKLGKRNARALSTTGSYSRTIALCHNCGNSWTVWSQKEEKFVKKGRGCLKVFLIALGVLMVLSFAAAFFSSYSDKPGEPAPSRSASSAKATARWATSITPLDDFEYILEDGILHLERYRGYEKTLWIPCEYDVSGTVHPTDLERLYIDWACESVILEEGITAINVATFNSTDIERLYIPQSMTVLYDDTLAPINTSLKEIYYGGTEKQWDKMFQHYEPADVSQKMDEGKYEEAGEALAGKLNQKLGLSEFDLTNKALVFNADPAHLS